MPKTRPMIGKLLESLRRTARREAEARRAKGLTVCPHCWMVNPGPCRLCGRCGADVNTLLQESGGLRRTAPVQSPVPVSASHRLSPLQRVTVAAFVLLLVLSYLILLLPPSPDGAEPYAGPGAPATPTGSLE